MSEDRSWRVILNVHPDEPVFHAMMHAGNSVFPGYAHCGRRIGEYKPWIPHRHAVKFARPCKDCFRERSETDA